MLELLTPAEMAMVDRFAAENGPHDGRALMRNAGAAVAAAVLERFPDAEHVAVLCGPGNNGGDGYVVARKLAEAGVSVEVFALVPPRPGGDAAAVADECPVAPRAATSFDAARFDLIVDGLFGAGLDREIDGEAAELIERVNRSGKAVVAIDLPSGISGKSGQVMGHAFSAELTVTFFRKKPGHLLYPGRARCGSLILADIGIPDAALHDIAPKLRENSPRFWPDAVATPDETTHKYRRGHCAVFSGGPSSTGAGRLAAMAALRSGAGAVTVLSPPEAVLVNATHLTAIMLRRVADMDHLTEFVRERKPSSYVLGPGFGVGEKARDFALALLANDSAMPAYGGLVLDGDGITAFAENPQPLFDAASEAATGGGSRLVLTPHEGEFRRLFPDLADDHALSKVEKAREAALRATAVVVYKGPDTVVAAPDGRAVINTNATSWLATAGSGDVLAGALGGLLAQGVPGFDAAAAAVWLHAEAGNLAGSRLTAEDLPDMLPGAFDTALGSLAE